VKVPWLPVYATQMNSLHPHAQQSPSTSTQAQHPVSLHYPLYPMPACSASPRYPQTHAAGLPVYELPARPNQHRHHTRCGTPQGVVSHSVCEGQEFALLGSEPAVLALVPSPPTSPVTCPGSKLPTSPVTCPGSKPPH